MNNSMTPEQVAEGIINLILNFPECADETPSFWVSEITKRIHAQRAQAVEDVKAERDRYKQAAEMLRETVVKSLQPQFITCDGVYCTGCWKDLARDSIKETAWMEEAKNEIKR
jgi:hypothetical protein